MAVYPRQASVRQLLHVATALVVVEVDARCCGTNDHPLFLCNDHPTRNHPSSPHSPCPSSEANPFRTVHCWLCSTHCSTSRPHSVLDPPQSNPCKLDDGQASHIFNDSTRRWHAPESSTPTMSQ